MPKKLFFKVSAKSQNKIPIVIQPGFFLNETTEKREITP